jgi:hypothetical protein
MAALCFLGTLGLAVLLVIATVVLFFTRRAGARAIRYSRWWPCSSATDF